MARQKIIDNKAEDDHGEMNIMRKIVKMTKTKNYMRI